MKNVTRVSRYVIVFLALSLLAACSDNPQPTTTIIVDILTPQPTAIPTTAASTTLAASPTDAPTATPAPSATPAPTLTPTPEPNPLTIEAMRQRQYPGSNVVIEQTLAPGSNYKRYIASYQSEGLKIYALLTVPAGPKPATGWPVIIFNHGFIPPQIYRPTERYVAYVDAIARSGYIVFRPDYRGNGNSEGEAHGAYGSPDYVVDDLNALASMKIYPDADPTRIGMWGHSMGGYITLRAMVISKDIKAGVIWGGVVGSYPDMMSKWRRPQSDAYFATATPGRPNWRRMLIDTYGTPEQNPAFWNSISANSYLADVSGPIQLHHGGADTEVPLAFSQTLYQELQAAGKTSEFYTYPGSDHNIAAGFSLAMQRSIAFFDEYVKGTAKNGD